MVDKMEKDIRTIEGNWPLQGHYTNQKIFDPYEARAVENLIGTICDLVQDKNVEDALVALSNLSERFDTRTGDKTPSGFLF
jgi:hypothetical protein